MSPLARASATSTPATAERSVAMPPSSSETPRIGRPISLLGLEDVHGRLAGLVGVGGGRAEDLGGVLGDDVDEHLLVLGRGQVEEPGRLGGRDALAAALRALAGELAAHRADGLEAGLGGGEDRLLRGLAQPEPVEGGALGELVQRGDGEADRVGLLGGGKAAPAVELASRGELSVDMQANVTASYTPRHTWVRCRRSHPTGELREAILGPLRLHAGTAGEVGRDLLVGQAVRRAQPAHDRRDVRRCRGAQPERARRRDLRR